MIFKPMKPEDVRRAIEGHKDIITPAITEVRRFIRGLSCISCGGDVIEIVNSKVLFTEGNILPNFLAECISCKVQFEPYTRIQVAMPSK